MTSNAASVRALHVALPDHGGRNPLVLVVLLIQESWTVKVAVQRLRDGLVMRMPTAIDSTPGVAAAPGLWKEMASAALVAVAADPVAMARLEETGSYPGGRPKHRPLPTPLTIVPPA